MKRTSSLLLLAVATLTITFTACKKDSVSGTGVPAGQNQLQLILTDGPSVVFDSIFVDIRQVEIRVVKADGSETWQNLSISAGVYNILRLRNGVETVLATTLIPDGSIDKLRLTLGTNNTVVKSGVTYPLYLHGGQTQYTINIGHDVDEDGDADHLKFWLDFDGYGSVVETSPNHFELTASLHHFSHHNSAELEGKIKPAGALPVVVKVVAGSDTLTAIPESEGEFKVRGIQTSTVSLIIRASNNYKDSVISNIALSRGNDTNIGTITLHQ
ncbi:MAG: DUF4382 domain-containing protein [Ferruginibacter sp.]